MINKFYSYDENSALKKKISDLEYSNSLLSQKNAILEKKLEQITNKYNNIRNELIDIEEHINFCKENQIAILDLKRDDLINNPTIKNLNISNSNADFYEFKKKLKVLFEYNDEFMKSCDRDIYNLIIDDISSLKNENIILKKTIDELNVNLPMDAREFPIENENELNMDDQQMFGGDFEVNEDISTDNVNKKCINSKQCLNNLLNSIKNLKKVINNKTNVYDLPKTDYRFLKGNRFVNNKI